MNKLVLLLSSFIASRTLLIFVSGYTEGAIVFLVGCFLYVLMFVLFSPRTADKKPDASIGKTLLTVTAFVLTSLALSSLLNLFFEIEKRDVSLLQGLVAVLAVPVAEELFFRATLFKVLDGLVPSAFAVFVSSLIFALSHTGLASIISSFVLGVILTVTYKKSGSIMLPALCHTANNLLALVLLKGF